VPAEVRVQWPGQMSERLAVAANSLIGVVSGLGGAVGWRGVPPRPETDGWLAGVIAAAAAGDGGLCTVWREDSLVAMGVWRRHEAIYFRHLAEIGKVMVHPQARGGRLGRLVTQELVSGAARSGIEVVQLAVRGNNHLALQMYEELGFTEWGRLPDALEVGSDRFDQVWMYLRLAVPDGVVLRGSTPSGPGYAPPVSGS
jgi:ribosomal protein S18 acetylase RimI-like enzyme